MRNFLNYLTLWQYEEYAGCLDCVYILHIYIYIYIYSQTCSFGHLDILFDLLFDHMHAIVPTILKIPRDKPRNLFVYEMDQMNDKNSSWRVCGTCMHLSALLAYFHAAKPRAQLSNYIGLMNDNLNFTKCFVVRGPRLSCTYIYFLVLIMV